MSPRPASPLSWSFPILRPHAGVPLANGVQGLLVWGAGRELRITIARQGFWHRQGGNPAIAHTDYQTLRRHLEANDAEAITAIFGEHKGQWAAQPRQLGGARLAVTLPAGWTWRDAVLGRDGAVSVHAANTDGTTARFILRQAITRERAWLELPANGPRLRIGLTPAGELCAEQFKKYGFPLPEAWSGRDAWGCLQRLPADPALGIQVRRLGNVLHLATGLEVADRAAVESLLAEPTDTAAETRNARRWWKDYWADVPAIGLPEADLNEAVEFGLHKLAICTPPHGLPCALQGPLMEDQQPPPWSNDYHFNINVQMIHYPLLAANRPQHLEPLWTLLRGLMPRLREIGARFFGDPEAVLLPHATNDRGEVIGAFWTGSIDHGCTAWMALMAWWQYRFTGDRAFLREFAWPFLRGAFAGYWAMLADGDDGRKHLPVSVSPEFRGSAMNAWGRDASFQLAALHATVQALTAASSELGEAADPRWSEVAAKVPPYATVVGSKFIEWPGKDEPRIGLWQGQDLDFSHRHHSHLAGIWPFASFDPAAPEHAAIVANSLHRWTLIGPGGWSGWCVPWAATIQARVGNPDAWLRWMHHWRDVFVNEGRGTLHDSAYAGGSALHTGGFSGGNGVGAVSFHHLPIDVANTEIFQLDAGCGALTAIFELLLQSRGDGLHILPAGLPMRWRDLSFARLGAEGGFRIGATVRDRRLVAVGVDSQRGGPLTLWHGLERDARGALRPRRICQRRFTAGEHWEWTA